jgi:hypothetical protein
MSKPTIKRRIARLRRRFFPLTHAIIEDLDGGRLTVWVRQHFSATAQAIDVYLNDKCVIKGRTAPD